MGDKTEQIVKDAASNVECETDKTTSIETLEQMKQQLLGLLGKSDDSFIYGLVKNVRRQRLIKNGKRK